MKLGANPESGFNAVANAEPGLTPLSEISECRREGCSPLILSLKVGYNKGGNI